MSTLDRPPSSAPATEELGDSAQAELDAIRQPFPDGSERYINRELSWLRFNERVLEEALDNDNPLLERVRFLSIFGTNLDEFFMIRVSGLRRQFESGVVESPPDGMTPAQQLSAIRTRVLAALERAQQCWRDELKPQLNEAGVEVVSWADLDESERSWLRDHFEATIFPVLTPLAFDPTHPFPHISNLSINLAVVVRDRDNEQRFARLKVPATLPRLLGIPDESETDAQRLGLATRESHRFILLEECVEHNLDLLFPELEVISAYSFRVTRDADLEIEEDEAGDLLTAMEEVVEQRHFGSVVRLQIDSALPDQIRRILERNLKIAAYQVYTSEEVLGLGDLATLADLDMPEHKFPPFQPWLPPALSAEEDLFSVIEERDVVLFQPYDSFTPVIEFVRQAATDPSVLAIKMTLYRVGPNSPIVKQLMEARENGKQVSVLVELKARFDEENNIAWAQALEKAGVHVAYGLVGLKTHAKLCLVVRRENGGMRTYVHLSTGNYNPVTARVYTDLGLFTADPELGRDVSDLFNALTGYSEKTNYSKLMVSPVQMREQLIRRIDREIERQRVHGDGHIVFKCNALGDTKCIDALYRASQAGVRVDLQVRGICCLRPGIPGLSENIRVSSVVGRFLEHSRIYYFFNGGDDELWSGSADLLPRNLDGRFEVLFPIVDPKLKAALRRDVLDLHIHDNVAARFLQPDGEYTAKPKAQSGNSEAINSQKLLLERGGGWRLS